MAGGKELGDRVMDLRRARGQTQEELAKKAGTSPTTISNLESGKIKNPQRRTLRRIAAALGVSVEELEDPAKAAVERARDLLLGCRVVAGQYAREWSKVLEDLRETGVPPEGSEQDKMLVVAGSMQDMFMQSFETIHQAARAGGVMSPYEWPPNLKKIAVEAGVLVDISCDIALRISEESASMRPGDRKGTVDKSVLIGRMPEELTRDPAWGAALEEARAVR
jgi:transcriptional regulator with XRE-family HTH domain